MHSGKLLSLSVTRNLAVPLVWHNYQVHVVYVWSAYGVPEPALLLCHNSFSYNLLVTRINVPYHSATCYDLPSSRLCTLLVLDDHFSWMTWLHYPLVAPILL